MVIPKSSEAIRDPETGVAEEMLKRVGKASVEVPERFVSVSSLLMTLIMYGLKHSL